VADIADSKALYRQDTDTTGGNPRFLPAAAKNNSKEQPATTARNHQKQPAITDTRFVRRRLRSREAGRHTGCVCFSLMTLECHAIMAIL